MLYCRIRRVGSGNHMAMGRVGKAAGIDIAKLRLVIFNATGEAIAAVIGGHVDLVPATLSSVLPYAQGAKSGGLRIIAIAAPQRMGGAIAQVPTWREQNVDVVQDSFRAVVGAKGLAREQVAYWDGVFSALTASPAWKKDVEAKNFENTYSNGADTKKLMESQYAELAKTLK